MGKNQIKIVAQVITKGIIYKANLQLPAFYVNANDFKTAKSIVKTMFEGQNLIGQMQNFDGDLEDFEV